MVRGSAAGLGWSSHRHETDSCRHSGWAEQGVAVSIGPRDNGTNRTDITPLLTPVRHIADIFFLDAHPWMGDWLFASRVWRTWSKQIRSGLQRQHWRDWTTNAPSPLPEQCEGKKNSFFLCPFDAGRVSFARYSKYGWMIFERTPLSLGRLRRRVARDIRWRSENWRLRPVTQDGGVPHSRGHGSGKHGGMVQAMARDEELSGYSRR